jgi:hypothetical protein
MRFFLAPLFTLVLAALVVANPVRSYFVNECLLHSTLISTSTHRYPNGMLRGSQNLSKGLDGSELIKELASWMERL